MKRKQIRTIIREEVDDDPLYGFVVDKSQSLLLLAVEDDLVGWLPNSSNKRHHLKQSQ